MIRRLSPILSLLFLAFGLVLLLLHWRKPGAEEPGPRSVADRIGEFGDKADAALTPAFEAAGVPYPPHVLRLIAFKAERRLELYAGSGSDGLKFIKAYPILGASGLPGPKLAEGDRQVPEGTYPIALLNPNSSYHLSLRVGYPNADDLRRAAADGRDPSALGGDIMIHGGSASIGCLAIGDTAIEEVFVLAARTGLENINLLIAPCDFRSGASVTVPPTAPDWTASLHEDLRRSLMALPDPGARRNFPPR